MPFFLKNYRYKVYPINSHTVQAFQNKCCFPAKYIPAKCCFPVHLTKSGEPHYVKDVNVAKTCTQARPLQDLIQEQKERRNIIFVHADQEKLTYRKSNKTVLVKVVKGNEKLNQNGANTVRKTFHLSWSAKLMLKFTVHDKTIPCCNIKVFNPHAKKFQYISRFLQAMPNNISRIQSYLVNDK